MRKKLLAVGYLLAAILFSNCFVSFAAPKAASGTKYNYLIILDNKSLIEPLRDFIQYKTNEGFKTKTILADDIKAKGKDNAEKLRNYLIAEETKNNLEYVLFVGDPFNPKKANPQETGGKIPMKYVYDFRLIHTAEYTSDSYIDKGNGLLTETGNIPTDIYYAVNINWDGDKDGFSGETSDDISVAQHISFKAMFKLGRIPFSDPDSVKKILQHTIKKETDYCKKTNQPKALLAAGIIRFFSPKTIDGAYFTQPLKSSLVGKKYQVTTLYEKQGQETSQYASTIDLNASNFSTEWNKGYDFIATEAHDGYLRYCWNKDANGNNIPDDAGDIFMESFMNLSDLTNTDNGFLLMSGCATARVERDRYDCIVPQIPQFLLDQSIVAGVGTTKTNGYNDSSLSYSICPFWSNAYQTYGECFYEAVNKMFLSFKKDNFDFFHNLYAYNYFGDPSFKTPVTK